MHIEHSRPGVKKNGKSRLKLIEHLALVHPAEYQTLADQLEVTPGPKLNDLLFEGLASELIFKAMSLIEAKLKVEDITLS